MPSMEALCTALPEVYSPKYLQEGCSRKFGGIKEGGAATLRPAKVASKYLRVKPC
jgi:hypothetical protein